MTAYNQDYETLSGSSLVKKKNKGSLKIFFGYAEGAGKTYAMLQEAHDARKNKTDVVIGWVDSQDYPITIKKTKEFERLPYIEMEQDGVKRKEFDLDGAIRRKPQLILVDDLSHINAKGCRHQKRYQDVRELLNAGINVYTTVNVKNIESLNDLVTSLTGISVQDRIPDYVFDNADQVELIDVEPQELIKRREQIHFESETRGDIHSENPFTLEILTALREIALRRCADRVNHLMEEEREKKSRLHLADEHILVCLSGSPTNAKIIRTAARMANAFHGSFTALYVQTPEDDFMDNKRKEQLRANIHLAQQLGAEIETVYGDDVAFQIGEFARLSGISKIVIGRSTKRRKRFFNKLSFTEQLLVNVPDVDIHIIPDQESEITAYCDRRKHHPPLFSISDILKSAGILLIVSMLGYLFEWLGFEEANIITIYLLAVLIISVVTNNRIYSLISSVVSVLIFNFLFTEPKYTLQAYEKGYPVTFLVMFIAAFLTGTLATKLKMNAKQSARSAFRTKILLDTNQFMQQAKSKDEILNATAHQLVRLLNRDVIIYSVEKGQLGSAIFCGTQEGNTEEKYITDEEKKVAMWALENNKHAGATTQTFSQARCLYLAIRVKDNVYGVVGISIDQQPLEPFENSILLSILGDCALILENRKNAKEKEEAALLAQNEQLRANLLRAISHDLRTPLTSISGNASNLLFNGESFDTKTKNNLYQDIYDDSMWLINLVENLLSVTRLEEGRLNLHISAELVDEVIKEALRHVNRLTRKHTVIIENENDLLLAKMDAKLIVQVLINLIDNAIKYTPQDSHIYIRTKQKDNWAVITIADDGPGIKDEDKEKIFDMFYSGANRIADSRRSLGLGLSLCRSIINAHGGTIEVSDHAPHGAEFTFTLPIEEVQLHE